MCAKMALKLGDIDVTQEILELHFQLRRTQLLLDEVIKIVPVVGNPITTDLIKQIDDKAFKYIQDKFPNMGIKKN